MPIEATIETGGKRKAPYVHHVLLYVEHIGNNGNEPTRLHGRNGSRIMAGGRFLMLDTSEGVGAQLARRINRLGLTHERAS